MHDVGPKGDWRAHEIDIMEKKYIQIFDGYKGAYGVANIKNAYVDPDSGKLKLKPGDYRWNYEELADQVYIDHLNGTKSIGIQPCNEEGETKFGLIDIDPGNYEHFRQKIYYRQNSRIQTTSHTYSIQK